MALPSMGPRPRYLEELRIGGGFDSAPDGGVDMDRSGNVASNGDFTVGGLLDARGGIANSLSGEALELNGETRFLGPYGPGPGGINRSWSAWLGPETVLLSPSAAPAGPNATWNGNFSGNFRHLDFSPSIRQFTAWALALPPDYDGSPLTATLFWTAASGTVSDAVVWRVRLGAFEEGDDPNVVMDGAGGAIVDTLIQVDRIHSISSDSVSPGDAMAEGLLLVNVERHSTNAADTLTGEARLIGVRLQYEA